MRIYTLYSSPDGSGNLFLWFCHPELVEGQNHKKDCNAQQEVAPKNNENYNNC